MQHTTHVQLLLKAPRVNRVPCLEPPSLHSVRAHNICNTDTDKANTHAHPFPSCLLLRVFYFKFIGSSSKSPGPLAGSPWCFNCLLCSLSWK